MEKVVKVSIGNIVFSLEEKAQLRISSYLSSLEQHYNANQNAREIIDGIEDRMAELLIERVGVDRIINELTAIEVVSILGKPETIDEEAGEKEKTSSGRMKRKLYRNLSNKKLGGVCSGLGEFFDSEATFFRLIFGVLGGIFLLQVVGVHLGGILIPLTILGGFVFVAYFFLWIFIPPAKTLEQRCAMKGESPSIDSIQRKVEEGIREVVDRAKEIGENNQFFVLLATIFSKIFGFAFILISIVGLILGLFLFLGVFNDFAELLGMLDGYAIFADSVNVKLMIKGLMILIYFIPFVGMLYSGMVMLFGFSFPKYKPGLFLFIIWIISLISLVVLGVNSSSKFFNGEHRYAYDPLALDNDTLYVEFVDVRRWEDEKAYIKANKYDYDLLFIDDSDRKNVKIIDYPRLRIIKDDRKSEIRVSSTIFPEDLTLSETKKILKLNFHRFDGKTLYLEPIEYSKGNPVREIKRRVSLYLNEDIVIIVRDPIYHKFENSFEYSNIPWLRK